MLTLPWWHLLDLLDILSMTLISVWFWFWFCLFWFTPLISTLYSYVYSYPAWIYSPHAYQQNTPLALVLQPMHMYSAILCLFPFPFCLVSSCPLFYWVPRMNTLFLFLLLLMFQHPSLSLFSLARVRVSDIATWCLCSGLCKWSNSVLSTLYLHHCH